MSETIVRSESGKAIAEADDWVCVCGNMPHSDGFYPCLPDGTEVEPLQDGPWDGLYVCARCTRIVDGDTGEQVREPGPVVWMF